LLNKDSQKQASFGVYILSAKDTGGSIKGTYTRLRSHSLTT